MNKLDIIIPVKNEEKSIKELAFRIQKSLSRANISYSMIFVDDHSTDATESEIRKLINIYPVTYHLKRGKPGKATSIIEGSALGDAPFVAMIDGDLQYPPEALPELYKIAQENGIAIADRKKKKTSALRQFISNINKKIFAQGLLGIKADVQSGLKVFSREILTHLDINSITPWTFDIALLATGKDLGFTIGSFPIEFAEREFGFSKINVSRASMEIGMQAVKHKFRAKKIYNIRPVDKSKINSGVAYKGKRFTTHTHLDHSETALVTFTDSQKVFFASVISIIIAGLVIVPFATLTTILALITFIYFTDVIFTLSVLVKSLNFPPELVETKESIDALNDKNLPVYTILCPLYKESEVLPDFIESMQELNWPKDKLEVLLLLEENDKETIDVAQKTDLPKYIKIVIVPDSFPKTKPKACNYGLHHATGEYVVVYDAEDKPDPDQLKKAYLAFNRLGAKYFCVQSKLNYFNPKQNLLTRLFTAEYSLWFDITLPGLQSIDSVIPLGGTSNHFRTVNLIEINAWDPFNVTEDCDLGIRLFRRGYKTAIIDSVTYEEANSQVKNWIRQRSRWIKGYFQTYLVHMRNPLELLIAHGPHALLFQLIIGMRITFLLINPFLWVTTIAYFTLRAYVGPAIESLFPPLVFYMASFALVVGNFTYIYNYMIGLAKRGSWELVKFVFLVPIYWVLMSIAAVMALYQLITNPHYWEKTNHGLNKGKKNNEPKKVITKSFKPENKKFSFDPIKLIVINANKTLTTGSALVLASIFSNFMNFLVSIILVRYADISAYATISALGSLVGIIQIPFTALSQTITYKSGNLLGKIGIPSKYLLNIEKKKAFIPALMGMIGWLVFSPAASMFLNIPIIIILSITPVWFFGIYNAVNGGYLAGSLKYFHLAVMLAVETSIKALFMAIGLIYKNPTFLYLSIPVSLLATFFLGNLFSKKIKGSDIEVHIPKQNKFFASNLASQLSYAIFLSGDIILAKHFLPDEAAGKYILVSTIGKIIYFLGHLFAQFVLSVSSVDVGAKSKNASKNFAKLLTATSFAAISGFIVFGIFGPSTLPIIYGAERIALIAPYLIPYTLGMAAITISYALISYNQSRNRHTVSVICSIFALIMIWAISVSNHTISSVVNAVSITAILFTATLLLTNIIQDINALITPKDKIKKGLNILVLNWRDTSHKWAGGAEVFVDETIKVWLSQGHNVTLFCGNDGSQLIREKHKNYQVIRRGGLHSSFIWAFIYYMLEFRGKFDLVVESDSALPFFTPIYSRAPKLLIIYHVHQEVFANYLSKSKAKFARFLERRLIPLFYRGINIVAISESTKNDLVNKLGINERQIVIVNPGIKSEDYKKSKKTKYPSFSYVGRLQHYKNIDVLINAFAMVKAKYSNAKLSIAGHGESRDLLEKHVNQLGLNDSVKFLGKVSEEKKIKLLGQSWAAVQPSSYEGWGITVIEANATGTPVIASNISGLKDSVVDEITGYLVETKNIKSFAHAMEKIIKHQKTRQKLSANALNWASRFSWERTANLILLESGHVNKITVANDSNVFEI